MIYKFLPPLFRDRWRLVAAAAATSDHRLDQIKVECYPSGIRLVGTDQYVLATTWVPDLEGEGIIAPWEEAPVEWFTVTAHDRLLKALLTDNNHLTLQPNVNDRSVTFSGDNWSLTLPTAQTDIGNWRHLFAESPDHFTDIAIGRPILDYFVKIAPLLKPEYNVMMRWYNKGGKVTPFQFSIAQHELRGLAMPINVPEGPKW